MCGIVASINFSLNTQLINTTLGHRGPDDRNDYHYQNVHFCHLRLSIQDIGAGKQPMHLSDKYSIIFNGEIYNHQELRKQFNLTCTTNSDTETLLRLYEILGEKCLSYIDGMFAFVMIDKEKDQLFIARDRAGKKPIYYYLKDDKFVIASELNTLSTLLKPEINEINIHHYLKTGGLFRNNTPYKNILEVEAGTILKVNLNTLSTEKSKWWNITDFYLNSSSDTFDESLEKVDFHLNTAIKRRVDASDLEVASFLSGGIDSGLVTAIAKKYNPSIKTFTVGFNNEYDETHLAKLVADKYNTVHNQIIIDFDNLENDIEKIISNYGEPFFDSSAIPSYYVSQEAKKHVTVILNGDGADELFGGYRRYVPIKYLNFFSENKIISTVSKQILNFLPKANEKKSNYNYLYRLIDFSSRTGYGKYLSATGDIFEGYEKECYIDFPETSIQDFIHYFSKISNEKNMSSLKKMMNIDFDFILFSDLLVKMDIATMSASLEGRSPFLSKELLEYAPTLKDNYKINGITTKYLLRTLGKKYLPEQILNQPKRGFEIPLKNWIDGKLNTIITDYLNQNNAYYKNFIKKDFVEKLLTRKLGVSDEKRAKMIWSIFCLEVWYQRCYKTIN